MRNVGKRAKFSTNLRAVEAQTLTNRCDLEKMMGLTQDAIEDVMKVVLADMRQTTRLTDLELERLRTQAGDLEEEKQDLLTYANTLLHHHMWEAWWKLRPWDRGINWKMRPDRCLR
ncbi:MAG TPA: hypothetical protein VMW79_08025 [Anaerolineae bacterium]|nr:hypothetical protein [Anaerolineae bacterium]